MIKGLKRIFKQIRLKPENLTGVENLLGFIFINKLIFKAYNK